MAKKYEFEKPETKAYEPIKVEQPALYTPSTYDPNKGVYASDYAKAQAEYEAAKAAKPAAYQSQYSGQIGRIIDKLNNRKFNYDVNSDALFQQLKALYNEQGKLAMADTQGQAAAMTGGYGNSYGVAASQQAYQKAQEQLYDRIPELYQLALSRYQQEGNDLNNMYSILANQENADYGRYRDTVSDYNTERSFSENALNTLRNLGQSLWAQEEANAANANNQAWNNYWSGAQMNESARQYDTNLGWNNYWNGENMNYQAERDEVSDQQWQKQFDESVRQYDTNLAENKRQYDTSLAEQKRQFDEQMNYNYSRGSGSSGGSGGGSSSYSDVLARTQSELRMTNARSDLDKMLPKTLSTNNPLGVASSIANTVNNMAAAINVAKYINKDKELTDAERYKLMGDYSEKLNYDLWKLVK